MAKQCPVCMTEIKQLKHTLLCSCGVRLKRKKSSLLKHEKS